MRHGLYLLQAHDLKAGIDTGYLLIQTEMLDKIKNTVQNSDQLILD